MRHTCQYSLGMPQFAVAWLLNGIPGWNLGEMNEVNNGMSIWNNIVLPIFIVKFMVNRPGNHMKHIFGSSVYRSQSAPPLWFDWDKGHRSSQAQDHTCRHYLGSVKSSNANVWLKDKRHHIVKYGVYIVPHDCATKLGTRIIYHIILKNTNQYKPINQIFSDRNLQVMHMNNQQKLFQSTRAGQF